MNGLALLGIILCIYAIFVFFVSFKKPDGIWNISKVKAFRKVLGEKGTVIFFIVWGILALVVGVWLIAK
ncbi:MAG: hypothetical protein ACTHW2_09205 [Tissierella sp.]|uniref:hypothetical protein n=1 Tax=Tissierella sp. TaxID=41274 RepID=UPI003F9467ED